MGFFDVARRAGAEQYGISRAEKYGRRAKAKRWAIFIALVIFFGYCWYLGQQ